jgi:CxxC-x17-CxxC domain-containing protein
MEFADRQITCMDCHQPFTFTAGEQEFYKRKGFREEPKRCKSCRANRNARRAGGGGQEQADGYGNGNGNGHARQAHDDADDDIGNRIAPGNSRGGGGREMFDATCAQCGTATRVPFRPVAGRPVYCRDCYGNRGAT